MIRKKLNLYFLVLLFLISGCGFKPILVGSDYNFKIARRQNEEIISVILTAIKKFDFDGVIASNTTIDKENLLFSGHKNLSGGLSGIPLHAKSNNLLKIAHSHDPSMLKIGVGGVDSKESFKKKLDLGASLVQIYTSFIYEGPHIVKKLLK